MGKVLQFEAREACPDEDDIHLAIGPVDDSPWPFPKDPEDFAAWIRERDRERAARKLRAKFWFGVFCGLVSGVVLTSFVSWFVAN